MILLAAALAGLGVADLLRWSPESVSHRRSGTAVAGATLAGTGLAALGGFGAGDLLAVAAALAVATGLWVGSGQLERVPPGASLAVVLTIVLAAFGLSAASTGISGPLERWYSSLPLGFVSEVPADQFVLAACALVFLLATGNRLVRLVLEAAGTPAADGETALRGGRVLGPLERVFVFAMVLAGDLTGAAVVIAAKGLLRLPEIRDERDRNNGTDDLVTEYFLIGTFTSLLLAGALGAVVIGAG